MHRASVGERLRAVGPVFKLGARRVLGAKSPFQVTFSLTNRCNFRCVYCEIPNQKREEMATEEWLACIDEFVDAGMGRASIIGGEPMVRKDCGEIIRHLKRRGVHTAMNTNGWFVKDRIDEIAELDVACMTLDGPREVHDRQRHRGSYDRVIQAIETFKSRGVAVVTMTVVTPEGADSVDHVLDVARTYGHKAFFQIEHDANCDVNLPIGRRMSDERIASFANDLLERRRAGQPVGNSEEVLQMQMRDLRRLGGDCSTCFAGRYFAYVLSDGTVSPCLLTQWQQQRGNGRSLGFARAFNEMPAPEGPGCGCVPIAEVNSILSFSPAALFDALEIAYESARLKLSTANLPVG